MYPQITCCGKDNVMVTKSKKELNKQNYSTLTKLVPLLGTISAGQPIYALENIEGHMEVDCECDFALRVKGTSMIGARIYDNDIVFVKRQNDVDHGDIAVVLVDGENATLKRIFKYHDKVILHPENPTMKDLEFTSNDKILQILGKVVEVKFKI